MITTIPFSGFYGTHHEAEIDGTLEQMLSDSSGCYPISDRISNDIWFHVSTPRVEYTKAFVESFQVLLNQETQLNVKLEWESVDSPKSCNFSTDRVYATVSFSDVQAMFNKLDKTVLDKTARSRFTSYDGFISHYSPNWKDWGSLKDWDHNQIGTILEGLVDEFLRPEWEWDVTEDWNSNGDLDNWVFDNLDEEGQRLVTLADYLRQREERRYR